MKQRSVAVLAALCLSAGTLMAADGQQVAVDEKGQLRQPTAKEVQSLTAAPARKQLVAKVTATGAVSIALDDRFDHMYVAHVNEAGELVFTCTDDHTAATNLVAQPNTIMRIRNNDGAKRVSERE